MALISSRRLQLERVTARNTPGEAIGVSEKSRISYFTNYEIEMRGLILDRTQSFQTWIFDPRFANV
jgi:hypothetical protein